MPVLQGRCAKSSGGKRSSAPPIIQKKRKRGKEKSRSFSLSSRHHRGDTDGDLLGSLLDTALDGRAGEVCGCGAASSDEPPGVRTDSEKYSLVTAFERLVQKWMALPVVNVGPLDVESTIGSESPADGGVGTWVVIVGVDCAAAASGSHGSVAACHEFKAGIGVVECKGELGDAVWSFAGREESHGLQVPRCVFFRLADLEDLH